MCATFEWIWNANSDFNLIIYSVQAPDGPHVFQSTGAPTLQDKETSEAETRHRNTERRRFRNGVTPANQFLCETFHAELVSSQLLLSVLSINRSVLAERRGSQKYTPHPFKWLIPVLWDSISQGHFWTPSLHFLFPIHFRRNSKYSIHFYYHVFEQETSIS